MRPVNSLCFRCGLPIDDGELYGEFTGSDGQTRYFHHPHICIALLKAKLATEMSKIGETKLTHK
jgi:hypothetical protein